MVIFLNGNPDVGAKTDDGNCVEASQLSQKAWFNVNAYSFSLLHPSSKFVSLASRQLADVVNVLVTKPTVADLGVSLKVTPELATGCRNFKKPGSVSSENEIHYIVKSRDQLSDDDENHRSQNRKKKKIDYGFIFISHQKMIGPKLTGSKIKDLDAFYPP